MEQSPAQVRAWAGIHHWLAPPAPGDLPEIRNTLDWLNDQPTVEDEQAGRGALRFTQLVPGRGGRGSY